VLDDDQWKPSWVDEKDIIWLKITNYVLVLHCGRHIGAVEIKCST
jgi:hypothetical protein